MTLTFANVSFPNVVASWQPPATAQAAPGPDTLRTDEVARIDRAFLHEMMVQHPEAMQSEFGAMTLMAHFPKVW